MNAYRCFCGSCEAHHTIFMAPDEYRVLAGIKGALRGDGRLLINCDYCTPLVYSERKAVC